MDGLDDAESAPAPVAAPSPPPSLPPAHVDAVEAVSEPLPLDVPAEVGVPPLLLHLHATTKCLAYLPHTSDVRCVTCLPCRWWLKLMLALTLTQAPTVTLMLPMTLLLARRGNDASVAREASNPTRVGRPTRRP